MPDEVKNSVPIGGDQAQLQCAECDSYNTVFEEYAYTTQLEECMAANSELGILCLDCNHTEDPDVLGHRFEPEYNPKP